MLSVLKATFWHPTEHRVRAPFRIIVVMGAALATLALVSVYIEQIPWSSFSHPVFLHSAVSTYSMIPIIGTVLFLSVRYVDRRTWRNFGMDVNRQWLAHFGVGFFIAVILITGVVSVLLLFGWAEVDGFFRNKSTVPLFLSVPVLLCGAVLLGCINEILFIHTFKNAAEGLSGYLSPEATLIGAFFVRSVFILLTLQEGASSGAAVFSMLVDLVLETILVLGFIYTAKCGFGSGMRAGWLTALGILFGGTVTTIEFPIAIIDLTLTGPPIITGGDFGLEGGLVAFFAAVMGVFLFFGWVRYTNQLSVAESVYTPSFRTTVRTDN